MIELANIHLQKKGVVWRVNMAYDVLYNEVSWHYFINNIMSCSIIVNMQAMVYLLMSKYDIDYNTAVECHLQETVPVRTHTQVVSELSEL